MLCPIGFVSDHMEVRWDLDTNVNRRMAYNHYFAKPAAPAKKS